MATVLLSSNRSGVDKAHRKVILASSLGTAFEWYDFFLYGSLAAVIARQFFAGVNEATGFIFALLTFAAGFAVRPLGALVFGRLGDLVGRKRTFLMTIVIMGTSTALVGVLPNYATAGIWAPVALVALRALQGLAVGGEYGGAAIYVAEHAPDGRRGLYTSLIQATSTVGLLISLVVILLCRTAFGADFDVWGWRLPFLLSTVLLAISVYIRLQLAESPVFQEMVRRGTCSKAPVRESFGNWANLKLVLLAFFGATAGMTVLWYGAHFYSLFFLTQVLKLAPQSANLLLAGALVIAMPLVVVAGALSDRYGRKRMWLLGCVLGAVTYFPIFHGLTHFANPAVEDAASHAPVTVIADPDNCSSQFDPLGKTSVVRACDVAKSALAKAGIPYSNERAPAGTVAAIRIGAATDALVIPSVDGAGMSAAELKAVSERFGKTLGAALKAAGYPATADPARVNYPMVLLLLTVLLAYAALVYGPLAAWLVELFPARIRYTSLSVPYHAAVGWLGGFLPAVAFSLVAISGDIYSGLWYPVVVVSVAGVIGALLLPDSRRGLPLD